VKRKSKKVTTKKFHSIAAQSIAMSSPGVCLLVEDTTAMSWSGNEPIAGLGPIGDGKAGLQGFLLHSVLAMRWWFELSNKENLKRLPIEILGISHQKSFVRKKRSEVEKKETNFKCKQRERESRSVGKFSNRVRRIRRRSTLCSCSGPRGRHF
jgi:hypothetical protein